MKRIICLVFAVCLAVLFCACGDDAKKTNTNNVSGVSADSNAVELVNSAYEATGKAIENAAALGFDCNMKFTSTLGEQVTASRISTSVEFVSGSGDKTVAMEMISKSGDISSVVQIYDDTKNIYAAKAGTTYLLSDNNETKNYIDSLVKLPTYFDASGRKAVDTIVVDTDGGGRGFVFEYAIDEDNTEIEELFGSNSFAALKELGVEITVTGLRISGIIDTDGRLTSQTVTFSYTYPVEVAVQPDEVDPNNPGGSEGSTATETQTANGEMVMEISLKYGITSVSVPDGITVISDGTGADGEEPKKPSEISLTDFNKLSVSSDK